MTCMSQLLFKSFNHLKVCLPFALVSLDLVFLPDMTFTHEGNKTFIDNLVNFEKMVRF